ncbi:MAG: flavodoxin family protein [Rhodocyclaceae bacterium]|nr:MAG: flavodoxin family protein [Rhodocyclaceae bacterium]
MATLLAITGSYRDEGIIDQAVAFAADAAARAGATVEVVQLRDYPIAFGRHCRQCTLTPGDAPGICVQQDGMQALIEKIEGADAIILASPTNFYSVTALFKRFMERLVVYAYWPWQMHGPEFRKKPPFSKKALVIASAAAPALLGRLFYSTLKQLRMTAKSIGATTVGDVFIGLAAGQPVTRLSEGQKRRIERLTRRLLA